MNRKPWFCEGWNDMTYEEQQLLADKYEAQREDAEAAKYEAQREDAEAAK